MNSVFTRARQTVEEELNILREIGNVTRSLRDKDQTTQQMISKALPVYTERLRKKHGELGSLLRRLQRVKPFSPPPSTPAPATPFSLPNNLPPSPQVPADRDPMVSESLPSIPSKVRDFTSLEKSTLKRLKKQKERQEKHREVKPSAYVSFANKLFGKHAQKLAKSPSFDSLKKDLVQASLPFVPSSYISLLFLSTLLSGVVGIFVFLFFLFFSIHATPPFLSIVEVSLFVRFAQTFWILFAVPLGTALFLYFYPSLEKSAAAIQIERELPFVTIHMAAISGSMLDPSKIFSILVSTGEYPRTSQEFTKIINEINVYGYDLVSALRRAASSSPSKRLAELFNGLATSITSGGDLPIFFEKRSQTLLFEYRIEREKQTRAAETFMDIYISVVIAAPMILMLLLMMIKISGLGLSLSTGALTLLMVLGVGVLNLLFLGFLGLKGGDVA